MMYQRTLLFENGTGGYRAYTTPTLLTTGSGAILAICEGRNSDPKVMGGDSGDIDLVLRRSLDGGRSWEPKRVIVRTGPDTDGNPAPVLDRETGIVWLLFCKNFADGAENLIVEGKAPRTVWVTCSRDEERAGRGRARSPARSRIPPGVGMPPDRATPSNWRAGGS